MKYTRRLLAIVLALVLALSCLSGLTFAAESAGNVTAKPAERTQELKGFKSVAFRQSNSYQYADDELVRAIIVMDGEPAAKATESTRGAAKVRLANQHNTLRKTMRSSKIDYTELFDYTSVLNGIAVEVAYGKLDAIAAMNGVAAVYIANRYSIPNDTIQMDYANVTTGADHIHTIGMDGSGVVVAVLDSGITPNHEAFAVYDDMLQEAALNEAAANSVISDKGRGAYLSQKIPFAYDYADQDNDATDDGADTQGHGTHVSGIAVGYAEAADGAVTFSGAAPDAQLLGMKIFGTAESTTSSDVYFAALDDAYDLGADVINMSIGSQNGFTYDSELENEVYGNIYEILEDAGVLVVTSAGNEYSQAEYASNWAGAGYLTPDYTDYGTIGSPSTYDGNLSVAAVENLAYPSEVLKVGEKYIAYNDSTDTHEFIKAMGGKSYDFIAVPNFGTPDDFTGVDVTGKIALISRGDITFEEKVENAANAGAAAAIVYNNAAGTIGMQIESYEIPAVSIQQADGEWLLDYLSTKGATRAPAAVYEKVTSNLTDYTGKYLIGYTEAGTTYIFNGIDAADNGTTIGHIKTTETDGKITYAEGMAVVDIATMEGGYSLKVELEGCANNGKYIKNNGASSNGTAFVDAAALTTIAVDAGTATITQDTCIYRFNSTSGQMRFRYYKASSTSMPLVTLYKLSDGTTPPPACEHDWGEGEVTTEPTCTEAGVRTYTCSKCSETKTEAIDALGHVDENGDNLCDVCNADLTPAAPVAISAALAGAEGETFLVKGVVTFVDGKNVYIQDATGGICAYFPTAAPTVAQGDTILVTGARATYNGLPELTPATMEASEGLTLTATEKTIPNLTTADICTYVSLKNMTVTEVNDNNGAWANPTVTISDGTNTIQIYKAVVDGIAVDDVVDVKAAVGVYNTTLQLRNTVATEITKVGTPPPAGGDMFFPAEMVVVDNPSAGLMCDFSGWGCTNDLRLKPQITGVGGQVYSVAYNSTDGYVVMGGTSMASPDVAGNYAAALEAVMSGFPAMTKPERAAFVEATTLSTANIITDADDYPYSPRKQGAGVINVAASGAAPSYILEPICNIGDDAAKTGVFTISFEVKNVTSGEQNYTINPTILFDFADQADMGTDEEPDIRTYNTLTSDELDATGCSIAAPETVTVPALGTVEVTVTVTLTAEFKAMLDETYPNGTFIEGFIELVPTVGEGNIHATFMGYYGDWTAAPIMEEHDWRDIVEAETWLGTTVVDEAGNTYADLGYTYLDTVDWETNTDINLTYLFGQGLFQNYTAYAGDNMFEYVSDYSEDRIAVSNGLADGDVYGTMLYAFPMNLRNARHLIMVATDAETGEIYTVDDTEYLPKVAYDSDNSYWAGAGSFIFDGTKTYGVDEPVDLPNNTKVNIDYYANLAYGEDTLGAIAYEDLLEQGESFKVWSYPCTVDTTMPTIDVENAVYDEAAGTLTLTVADNHYLAQVAAYDMDYETLDSVGYNDETAGQSHEVVLNVGTDNAVIYLSAADYATNENFMQIVLKEVPATVTFSAPEGFTVSGEAEIEAMVGETIALPDLEGTAPEGYSFICWTSAEYPEEVSADELADYYFPEEDYSVTGDVTFYAVFEREEAGEPSESLNMVVESKTDWTGAYAIDGYDWGTYDDYLMLSDGSALNCYENDITVDYDDDGIGTITGNDETVLFDIAKAADGDYTICARDTGKYAALGADGLEFVTEANEAAHWIISFNDDWWYTLITNKQDATKLLVFDEATSSFDILTCDVDEMVSEDGNGMNLALYEEGTLTPTYYYYTTNPGAAPVGEVVSVATALAGAEGASFTVEGVVTMVDGKNVYVQDTTGGICAYFAAAPEGVALGDTINVTGSRTTYNGLPELASAELGTTTAVVPLAAAVKTISELTDADICCYVTLEHLTITEIYDNNGAYTKPNITVTDLDGNTIQLYKAVVGAGLAVDDVISITAAVGVYNGTYQLRNTVADEVVQYAIPPIVGDDFTANYVETPEAGMQIVIYSASGAGIMGSESTSYTSGSGVTKLEQKVLAATVDGTILSAKRAGALWLTIGENADGTVSFTSPDGKFLYADGTDVKLADEQSDNTKFILEKVEGGYNIKCAVATYNDNAQYLECYKGVFTVYGMSTTYPQDFLFNFYKIEDHSHEHDFEKVDEDYFYTYYKCSGCEETKVEENAPFAYADSPSKDFGDIVDTWYRNGADYVIDAGIMASTSTEVNTFEPNTNMTRAMLVSMLYRLEKATPVTNFANPFTDVPAGQWYTDAVLWAAKNNIVNGTGDGTTFEPNANITREQIALLLYNYCKDFKKLDVSKADDLSTFSDKGEVSSWALTGVKWAVGEKLISGRSVDGKTTLAPKGNAMRCEIATLMASFVKTVLIPSTWAE